MQINRMMPLLNVEDVAQSLAFYVDALGFEVVETIAPEGTPIFAMIRRDGVEIMINTPDGADSASRRLATSYHETVLYFDIDDAPAFHAVLTAAGQKPGPVERQMYGVDEFTIRDPDGYELAFANRVDGEA